MSIHKSQGQTLDRVKVDLGKVFEKGYYAAQSLDYAILINDFVACSSGQAYVALSRATSLDGLQVLNFNPSKVYSILQSKRCSISETKSPGPSTS